MLDFSKHDQYPVMHGLFNGRKWWLFVATEASRIGPCGIAREAGVKRKTIRMGMEALEAEELYEPGGRIRRKYVESCKPVPTSFGRSL
jgi:hypothetical protein